MAALKDLYVKRNGAPSAPRGSWAEHVDELNKMSAGVMQQGETAGNGALGWLKDSADAGFFSSLGGTARLAGEFLPFGNETLNSWADKADEIARRNSPQPGQNLEGLDYVASAVGNALGSGAASALEAGAVAAAASGLGSLAGVGGLAGTVGGIASKAIPGVGAAAKAGQTLWKSPMGKYLVANVAGSPFEAASEAGNLISDMRNENQQGTANYSDEEIRDAAIRSGALNLAWLTGMNMLEAGTLGKITGALGGDMAAKGVKDIAKRTALGGLSSGIGEGAEEYGQNLIGDYSKRGNTSDFNYDEAWEAAKMGAIGGGVLGGIGSGLSAKFSKKNNNDVSAEVDSEGGTIEDGEATTTQDAGKEAFINAIAGQESGGNYDAVNGRTGAAGKYQIMPENWPAWAEEAGLGADAEMTPENQEIVARYKLGEYYDKYGARGAAMAWYAGEGSLNYSEEALNRRQGNGDEPSINEYADSVLARMGNYADTARIDDSEENYFDESNYTDQSILDATRSARGFDVSHLNNGEASDAESLSQFEKLSPEVKAQREADERRKQFNKLMDELRAAGDPQRAAQYDFERQNVPSDPLARNFDEQALPGIDAQKPFNNKTQTNLMHKRGRIGNAVSPDVQFEQGQFLPSLMQMARSPREMANVTNFELMNQRSIANKNWEQPQQTAPRYDTQAVDALLAEQQREEDRQKLGLLLGGMRESRAVQQAQEQSAKQSERQSLAEVLGRIAVQKWDEVPNAEKFKFVPQRRSMYDGAMRRNLAAQDRIKPDEQPSVKPTPVNRRALEGRDFVENVIAAGRKKFKNGERPMAVDSHGQYIENVRDLPKLEGLSERRAKKLSTNARMWRRQYQNDKTEREALRDAAISVWQGDPKHPMKECRRLLNLARNMRKEILQPIVDDMANQGIKQGVEFIPIEDRRTMRESHNAMWYRNYYKENKKAPSQTAMYDIAEDICLKGYDEYGVGYYAGVDSKGKKEIVESYHEDLDYINNAIEAYETLELKLKEDPNYGKEWATGETAAEETGATKTPRNSEAAEVKAEPTAKSDKDEVNKKAPALAEGYSTESGRSLEEADENEFILHKGEKNFGEITKVVADATDGTLKIAPIRLQVGNAEFGLKHLLKHEAQMQSKGFKNVYEFIDHVLKNFNQVYSQQTEKKPNRFVLYCKDDKSKGFMPIDLELKKDTNGYYTIVSAMPHNAKIKGTLIYDGSSRPSTVTTDSLLSSDINGKGGDDAEIVLAKSNVPLSTTSVAQEQENVKKTLLPKGVSADVQLAGNSITVKFNGKKPKEVSAIMGKNGYKWDSKTQTWKADAKNEQAMAIAKELGYKEQGAVSDKINTKPREEFITFEAIDSKGKRVFAASTNSGRRNRDGVLLPSSEIDEDSYQLAKEYGGYKDGRVAGVAFKDKKDRDNFVEAINNRETISTSDKEKYKYYLNARPASIGAVPKGFTRVDENDKGGRYGAIYYDKQLSDNDVKQYELQSAEAKAKAEAAEKEQKQIIRQANEELLKSDEIKAMAKNNSLSDFKLGYYDKIYDYLTDHVDDSENHMALLNNPDLVVETLDNEDIAKKAYDKLRKESAANNGENVVESKQDNTEGGSENDINGAEKLSQDDTGSRGTSNEVRGLAEGERPSAGNGQRSETSGGQGRSDRDNSVSGSRASAGGETSVRKGSEEASAVDDTSAGSSELSTSVVDSLQGKPDAEGQTTRDVVESAKDGQVNAADTVTTKVDKVIKENSLNSKRASRLRKTAKAMPFLSTIQLSNSDFVADRFTDNGKQGVMITDGTGTGKTFSGLSVAKELVEKGKDNILVVTPSDSINNQWVSAAGEFFGINLNKLEDTKDAGKGAVITTYANLGANEALIKRNWDLVICDESHNLMNSEKGEKTAALTKMRQLTLHPTELNHRAEQLILPEEKLKARQIVSQAARLKHQKDELTAEEQTIVDEADKLQKEEADKLTKEEVAAINAQVKDWEALNEAEKPKVMFMSATPFAYVPDIDYAEGYLFNYPKVEGGTYNQPGSGYAQFMMDHFGYRMRYNKLTKPDSKVDSSLMEVEFHEWLRKTGALTGHELEIDKDYNRGFLLVNQGVGRKIDEGFEFLQDNYKKYGQVLDVLRRQFDSRRRNYLLESIKARESVPIIKEYLKTGKKVVVFYETNVARESFNPFKFTPETQEVLDAGKENAQQIKREWEMFAKERPDLVNLNLNDLKEPISIYQEAFGDDAMFFNGRVPKKKRAEYVKEFNNDDSGKNLIFVQQDAGNAGISLHDTTGKHQRVLINIGIPRRPSYAIQIEGRIYRLGNKSNAIIRYLTTATNIENGLFAETVAGRASTAENLALGRKARGLRDSFKNAYQEILDGSWEDRMPGAEGEDVGGKENDRAIVSTSSDYDRAKAFYYARGKKTSKNKAAEGVDYFATPEPIGYKMVEWAGLKDGDKVLEPSAGHGAISRFFSPNTENTIIEPSGRLAPQAQMNTDNANLINGYFEDLHISNKYDAITMNPPFGTGGKTAVEHLAKAFKHLKDGGRVIAIIPDGASAEKRFNKWYESDDAKDAHMVGEVLLPSATFERAGTKVVTRIVLIDKGGESQGTKHIDLRSVDDINELFDKLENIGMPGRSQKAHIDISGAINDFKKVVAAKNQNATTDTGVATADTYKHTKTGELIPHAKLNKSLSNEEYSAAKKLATKNDGYYSKFAKGFLFKTEEGRDNFVKEVNEELATQYSIEQTAQGSTPTQKLAAKAVTELLDSAGIEVITDKTEFEQAMSGKVEYFKTAKGEVYGFTRGGKIYLDPELINADTPIHEYTHIWDKLLQITNPTLWRKGVEVMKRTPLWEEVKNNPAYANIANNENLLASEVHARLVGKNGAKVIEDMAKGKRATSGVITALKKWVKAFWYFLRNNFAKWSDDDIKKITVEDFANLPLMDIAKKTLLGKMIKEAESREDKAYLTAIKNGDTEKAAAMVKAKAERMGFTDAIPEHNATCSVRTKAAPKKTVKAYKVFYVDKNGRPSALFVNGSNALPQGVWLEASEGWHFVADNGRAYVPTMKNPNRKTAGSGKTGVDVKIPSEEIKQELINRGFLPEGSKAKSVTAVAYRPGWHGGDLPFFPQGGTKRGAHNYPNAHERNQVVFEVEMAADTDYTQHTTIKSGKNAGKEKYIDRQEMPTDGVYKFATNPLTNTSDLGAWYISGSLKIGRALTQKECDAILEKNGFLPQEWEQGEMNLADLGYTGGKQDAARKTLAPITYDNNGNVIPLSQRFNSEVEDIRYKIEPGNKNNKIASAFTNTERKGAIQSIKDYVKDLKENWYKDIVDKNNPLKGLDELTKATGGMSVYEKVQSIPGTTAGTLKAVCEGTTEHLKAINSRLKKKMKYNVTLAMALDVVNKDSMNKAHPNYLEENGFKNWPDAFGAYLGVERELEMHEKAKAEGETYTFSNNLTEAELREFVRKAPPQFAKAADMFYKVNDNMITIMEDAQVFSPKVAETLRKYKKYCPLQRDFSDTAAFDTFIGGLTSGGRGIGNVGVPLEKILIEGSDRTIMNPLESVLKSYAVMINRAERNRVGMMAVNAAKTAQLHDIIKEMPERKDSKGRVIEGVADPKNCIFTVLVNGRKKAYQTTQELYGPIVGYNLPAASLTLNVARMTAHMLRTGATMSPSFIVRNLLRDTVFAGISSKNGFIPIVDSIRGAMALWNDPAMRAEFEAAGVTEFNFYGSQASRIKSLDKMMGEQPVGLWEMIKWAATHLEAASDFVESSTRMGEYMKARKNGLSMEEAARAAREVTLDFSRSGVIGEQVNRYVPFFNACIQGGDKMVRLLKEDPWGTSQKLFQYIVLPSLILWAMNHDEDWYKDLDPDVKNNYWCLGEHLRIPKPQEAGVLFGSGIEALLDQANGKDKDALKNMAKAWVSNMVPGIVPTLFLPLLEWQANYSYFKGRALVGSKYQRLPDELQYNDYTSELSKAIGNNPLVKVSPMKVDNLIRGYTGTMGALLWSAPDALIGDSKNLPEKHLSERTFFRDFALTDANKSRPMNNFYDILDKANRQHAGYGVKGKPAEAVKGIRSAGNMISKIRKDVDKITHSNLTSERKRELIDKRKEKMNQIAKKATERYGKYFE